MKRILLLSIFAVVLPAQVRALPNFVEFTFTGSVTNHFGGTFFGLSPNVGDPISGYFRYDSNAVDDSADPQIGHYQLLPPSVYEIVLNGLHISSDGKFVISTQNNFSGADVFIMADGEQTTGADQTLLVNGSSQIGNLDLFLVDVTNSSWATKALPTAIDPSKFRDRDGSVQGISGQGSGVNFVVNTLVQVPEPASVALVLIASSLIAMRRSRREI